MEKLRHLGNPKAQTQKFEKSTRMAENTINNRDSIGNVPVRNIDDRRALAIENSINIELSLQVPPNTPPRQNVGQSYISPLSSEYELLLKLHNNNGFRRSLIRVRR